MNANNEGNAPAAIPGLREAVVHGRSDGFVQSIHVAGHALTADEPVAAGGCLEYVLKDRRELVGDRLVAEAGEPFDREALSRFAR